MNENSTSLCFISKLPIKTQHFLLNPQETSENERFSEVFKGGGGSKGNIGKRWVAVEHIQDIEPLLSFQTDHEKEFTDLDNLLVD